MSLTVEKSLLYPDINDIIKSPKDKYNHTFIFTAKLHTEEKDLDSSDGLLLTNIAISRDYIENISDYIEIQMSVHLGTYIYDIYPYLDNIEVTLITNKQLYEGKKPHSVTNRYKAVYLLDKNTAIPNTVNQDKADLNQNLPVTITLQLLDRSVETLRIKTTQGSFDKKINPKNKDMSAKAFLKSIISEEANKILIENKPPLDNISIEEPDNQDQLKALTIPSGTRIIELPEYIQTKNIGMYVGGIGNYIQIFGTDHFTYKKTFFIYSLYHPKKYDDAEYKLIFYCPASSSHSITDITYKYEDKVLKVLPYMTSKIEDRKESNLMSTGSGFRISNANSYMKKPVEMTEDGPKFKRDQLNTEIISKERKDGLNFAPNRSVTGNSFALTTEILEKQGSYLTLEVSNLDPDFIYPGMKCKINYENEENKIKELYGVIHRAFIRFSAQNMNLPNSYNSVHAELSSHMTLHIFVNFQE
jgi:hypothetical protein